MMHYFLQAWSEGRYAKNSGVPRDQNPYGKGKMAKAWDDGWLSSVVVGRKPKA